jgi:hypothetical protein
MFDNAVERRTDAKTRFETSWLIVRNDLGAGDGPPDVLTLGAGGGLESDGTILPVFSFEEEALLFLRLCGFGGGRHASKSGIGDLASVLSGACSEVRRVALDPIPEIGPHGPHALVSLSQEEFVGLPRRRAMMLRTGPRAATCAGSPRRPRAGRNRSRTGDSERRRASRKGLHISPAGRHERTGKPVGKDQIL